MVIPHKPAAKRRVATPGKGSVAMKSSSKPATGFSEEAGEAYLMVRGGGKRIKDQFIDKVFAKMVARDPGVAAKLRLARSGFSASVLPGMVNYLDVSKKTVFTVLKTPESTAHKAILEDKTLKPETSERIIRIADITRLAEETFSGREHAVSWLKRENPALNGASPLSMLDTGLGAEEVRKVLTAINYGGVF